jgi:hypothetical protein
VSATLSTVRANVFRKIRNRAGTVNLADTAVVDDTITSVMQTMAAEMHMGLSWDDSAVTTAAGTREYTLPASTEYQNVMLVRDQEQGYYLGKLTPERIEAFRIGNDNTGRPTHYALTENPPGSGNPHRVTITFGPTPDEARDYDLLRATVPVTLDDPADEVPFSEYALRALELFSAAEIIEAASDESLAAVKLSRGAARAYTARAERVLHYEKIRSASFERSGRLRTIER